jgi:methyl-accepting chemotaxis protein
MWVGIGTGVMLISIYGLLALLVRFAISPLRHVSQELTHGAENTFIAANQVAIASQRLAEGASEQAAAVEETSASLEQISSMIHSTANNATQAKNLSSETQMAARQGASCMAEMTSAMDSIEQSSAEVAKIVKSIDEIAFQTNILALNAAVEAARAGEQGRGFAVVASEVRSLAGRSADAAKEIKTLINNSVEKVEGGSQLVAQAGQTMSEIVTSVQRVTDIIGEITAASAEQAEGIAQVNSSVGELDQMTQQNAALVEEAAAASSSMREQAHRLAQVVAAFKLDASNSSGQPGQRAALRHAKPNQALSKPSASKSQNTSEGKMLLGSSAGQQGRKKSSAESGKEDSWESF